MNSRQARMNLMKSAALALPAILLICAPTFAQSGPLMQGFGRFPGAWPDGRYDGVLNSSQGRRLTAQQKRARLQAKNEEKMRLRQIEKERRAHQEKRDAELRAVMEQLTPEEREIWDKMQRQQRIHRERMDSDPAYAARVQQSVEQRQALLFGPIVLLPFLASGQPTVPKPPTSEEVEKRGDALRQEIQQNRKFQEDVRAGRIP